MGDVEDKAEQIRHLLIDAKVRAGEVAKSMGKSRQFVSRCMNPQQLENQQDEVIAHLNELIAMKKKEEKKKS